MNPLIYFIFYLIIFILSYRASFVWALAVSGFISLIIFIFDIRQVCYEAIIFILSFNAIPFIVEKFKADFSARKSRMRSELESIRIVYDNLSGDDKKQLELNLEAERKMQQALSLYEISKHMSSCLNFEDIFNIFSSALKRSFRFRLFKFIFLKNSDEAIDFVCKIEIGRLHVRSQPDNFDRDIVSIVLEERKKILLIRRENTRFLRRLSVVKNFDTLVIVPLILEGRIAGVLYIENIPELYFENFLILSGQLAIQLQRVMLYKKVLDLAVTDSLTGVYSRRYFLDKFREEIRRSMRRKAGLSFLVIDLDCFKEKNDKFGYLAGDVILKEIAAILKANLREIDIVGRYGEREFGAVLSGITKEGAFQVAERLRLNIKQTVFKAYDENIFCTVSIGISVFPEDGVDEDSLIESANQALCKSKEKGCNRVE